MVIAKDEDVIADDDWHEMHNLDETEVLGFLGCLVMSKAKDVGCADHH